VGVIGTPAEGSSSVFATPLATATVKKRLVIFRSGRPYFNHAATDSPAQISLIGWRARTTADFLPLTKTSAASERVL
jgi:hypothetical protein